MGASVGTGSVREAAADAPPLRFNDVIGELQRIADIAGQVGEAGSSEILAACRRAESLLARLRNQFLEDLVCLDGQADMSVA